MNIIKHFIIFSLGSVITTTAIADIYQWRDNSSGVIQFGNNPPKDNSTVSIISKTTSSKPADNGEDAASEDIKLVKSSLFRNSRRNNLLYQDVNKNKESRIISVRLLKESKNALIFDVNYYLSEKTNGTVNIGIIPNMDNWSSEYTKALQGRHATTISLKLSDSSKSIVRSNSLKLSMALAQETGYVGPIFEHNLPFNKVWYKK